MKTILSLIAVFWATTIALADTPPIIYNFSAPLVKTGGKNVSIPACSASQDGYMAHGDYNYLYSLVGLPSQGGHSGQFLTTNGTVASWVSGGGGGPTTWGSITGTLSNQTDLQSALNGKQNSLTIGNLTDAGTDGLSVTSGTGAVIGSGTILSQHVADTTHNGYLASSDWNTFSSKQPAGNYITALTGDVSASGPGSASATIAKPNGEFWVSFNPTHGNDTTGNGSIYRPWLTLQKACTAAGVVANVNFPATIHIMAESGNNDSDSDPILCPPDVNIISESYGVQTKGITITGEVGNDGVTLTNLIVLGNITWVRNDATAIALTLNNTNTFSGLNFQQQGSGVAQTFLFMFGANSGIFGTSTIRAGEWIAQGAGILSGTVNYLDSGGAFALISGGLDLFFLTLNLNGGITAEFSGNISDVGYAMSGTTTGSGTPTIMSDSGSLPPTITGAFTLQLTSLAKYNSYTATTSTDWNGTPPSDVNTALDRVAAALNALGHKP